jgi:glucosamine--fructose-6-phosphate aminotransferase (isomerizing)
MGEGSPLDDRARALVADLHRREREKALVLPTDDPLDPKRRRRVELTREEMWGQPEALQHTLERERPHILEVAGEFARRMPDRIVMVGCGDSLTSLMAARALYEQVLRIPCEPVQALDFVYYYHRTINARMLVIALSSSGTTTRTVEAVLLARALGAPTLALSNTAESPLMTEADASLLVHAERRGWPTQASTAALLVLYQFGLDLGRRGGGPAASIDDFESALHRTPAQVASALEQHDAATAEIAAAEADRSIYLYCGGGPAYACASFGAAKMKECSSSHAVAIPLEEFHHYNSQKSGDPLFLVAPRGMSLARACDTAEEGRRWGGHVYAVVTERDDTLEGKVDRQLHLPDMAEPLVPIVYTVPLQLIAYHTAVAKFRRAEAAAAS